MGKLMRFVVPCLLMALVVACSDTMEEKIASKNISYTVSAIENPSKNGPIYNVSVVVGDIQKTVLNSSAPLVQRTTKVNSIDEARRVLADAVDQYNRYRPAKSDAIEVNEVESVLANLEKKHGK